MNQEYVVFETAPSSTITDNLVIEEPVTEEYVVFERVQIGPPGPEGPPGPIGPGGGAVVVPFTFATGSPMVLQAVTSANILTRAAIVITTPFDDPAATVQLGTTTTPSLILAPGNVTTATDSQYANDLIAPFAFDDFLILTITPGASTQGSGIVYYWMQ